MILKRKLFILFLFLALQCAPKVTIPPGGCTAITAEQVASGDYFRKHRKDRVDDYKLVTQDKGDVFEIEVVRKERTQTAGEEMYMTMGGGASYKISKSDCRIVEKLYGQ